MGTTVTDIERLLDAIHYTDTRQADAIGYTLAHILRTLDLEDAQREEIQQHEHGEGAITVWRRGDSGQVLWIAEDDAHGTDLYTDPQSWADRIEDHAQEQGWDQDETPCIQDAFERAGVHHTGIQIEPTRQERIAAEADRALMTLYREIRGLD